MVDRNYVRYKNAYKKKAPTRAEHLKKFQWVPGESGNPEGRPTGSISLVESLKALLRRNPEALEEIVKSLIVEGMLGNMVATKEMLERIDGKVAETHRIEGEMPVKLIFVPAGELLDASEKPQGRQETSLEEKPMELLGEGQNPQ